MKENKKIACIAFGKNLAVSACNDEKGNNVYVIYNNKKAILGHATTNPIPSFKDSGYFPCDISGGKFVRYIGEDGMFAFGIYGKRSRPFINKMAKVERLDGSLTFINDKGKEMDLRFDEATDFIYPGPSAKVVFENEEGEYYIATNGHILDLSLNTIHWFEEAKESEI